MLEATVPNAAASSAIATGAAMIVKITLILATRNSAVTPTKLLSILLHILTLL
jgi:hypothetical protein